MAKTSYDTQQLQVLLYKALETELGGVKIYETAIRCAVNNDLKSEWKEMYLSLIVRLRCNVYTVTKHDVYNTVFNLIPFLLSLA